MRALILGLILVNILYWTWSGSIDSAPPKVARALDPDLPSLALVPRAANTELDVNSLEPLLVPPVGSDDVVTVDQQSGAALTVPTEDDVGADAPDEISAPLSEAISTDEAPKPVVPSDTSETPQVQQNLLAAADPATHPARCEGIGPFISLRQASEAAAILNQVGLNTAQRVEESQVWVGHWVYLPSYPSRNAAIAVVERLRKEGVKDIYIEPSGELKNTISLGLFTELERAEIRAGMVRKLGGVKPQIRNRSRDGLVYWIDVPLDAGITLDISALPHNSSQELKVEPVDCPPLSANG